MLIDFNILPENSRVWIYQSNQYLTDDKTEEIANKLKQFLLTWSAHGKDLSAGLEVKYNRFFIVGLDQTNQEATGCSIDAKVHLIQEIEKEFNIELLDKMNVAFKQGKYVNFKPLLDFKKLVKNGSVNNKTIVFNNLVNSIAEYKEHWEVPITESWHSRFL